MMRGRPMDAEWLSTWLAASGACRRCKLDGIAADTLAPEAVVDRIEYDLPKLAGGGEAKAARR
jgi:hypothetical protein